MAVAETWETLKHAVEAYTGLSRDTLSRRSILACASVLFLRLVASGGFGLAALSVLAWMYKYLTGKHPPGADRIEQARHRLAAKARDVKESAHQRMDQATH